MTERRRALLDHEAADPLTYLGQGHAAELPRRRLVRAALDLCRSAGAIYRPHPSERDKVSRLTHAAYRRAGIVVDGSVPLNRLTGPVVSVFSTGVLEAAAQGRDGLGRLPRRAGVAVRVLGALRHESLRRRADACARPPGGRAGATHRRDAPRDGGPMTLCVIPARGGSKGVPRKNLLDVAGKPLIVWTIEQALAVPDLDVLVSTDDVEIAEVARAAGARVPWLRPDELAQDTTPTEPVVRHAIEQVSAERGRPEAVMLLQATSPVRHDDTLARALVGVRRHRRGLDGRRGRAAAVRLAGG